MGQYQGRIAAALPVLAALLLAAGPLCAEGAGSKAESPVKTDSGLEAGMEFDFQDVDATAEVLDWGPGSGGLGSDGDAWSSTRFSFPGIPWLAMGPDVEAAWELDTDVVTPDDGNPYIVLESATLRGLAGWGGDAAFQLGAGTMKAGAKLLGGLGVLDLSEADADYLTSGAVAEDFWFRVEPCLGLEASCRYGLAGWDLRLRNRYLATWDSGTAYGRDWSSGFEEKLDWKSMFRILDGKELEWKAGATGDFSLESRLIVPHLKYSCAACSELDWKGIGVLKVRPVEWSFKGDVPGLEFASMEDTKSLLSGRIEWEAYVKGGSWSVYLECPYWAAEDEAVSCGEWTLGISTRLGG